MGSFRNMNKLGLVLELYYSSLLDMAASCRDSNVDELFRNIIYFHFTRTP
ncbi:hypothetical protein RchiOBHm_Chr6g0267841 [Rosa chinensis]|uniref:Uncharacterized protein n=1 Tax=Rosa chinensis TaxID=74649 RepID=A0A2P6PQ25_ROSCH|nr:hypothetical protein RchiOBHm_Chr6g0267841 [Rosa chinensis]